MLLEDALKAGYGVTTTKSRLVLRSGFDMPETYEENVSRNSISLICKEQMFEMLYMLSR